MMVTAASGIALFIKKIIVWCKLRKINKTLPITSPTINIKPPQVQDPFNNKPTEN